MKKFYNQFIKDAGRIILFIFMTIYLIIGLIQVPDYWWLFILMYILIVGLACRETYKDMKNLNDN